MQWKNSISRENVPAATTGTSQHGIYELGCLINSTGRQHIGATLLAMSPFVALSNSLPKRVFYGFSVAGGRSRQAEGLGHVWRWRLPFGVWLGGVQYLSRQKQSALAATTIAEPLKWGINIWSMLTLPHTLVIFILRTKQMILKVENYNIFPSIQIVSIW